MSYNKKIVYGIMLSIFGVWNSIYGAQIAITEKPATLQDAEKWLQGVCARHTVVQRVNPKIEVVSSDNSSTNYKIFWQSFSLHQLGYISKGTSCENDLKELRKKYNDWVFKFPVESLGFPLVIQSQECILKWCKLILHYKQSSGHILATADSLKSEVSSTLVKTSMCALGGLMMRNMMRDTIWDNNLAWAIPAGYAVYKLPGAVWSSWHRKSQLKAILEVLQTTQKCLYDVETLRDAARVIKPQPSYVNIARYGLVVGVAGTYMYTSGLGGNLYRNASWSNLSLAAGTLASRIGAKMYSCLGK